MSGFVSSAALNTLQVDGVYVYAQAPTPVGGGQGIDTSLSGLDGTAAWGQPNVPTPFSGAADLFAKFGSLANNTGAYSLVREGWMSSVLASSIGATFNGVGVRVTDGTDVAASVQLKDSGATNGVTLTAFYTGAEGNTINVLLSLGSNSTSGAPTLTATVQRGQYAPEVYPNLSNPTGGGFAVNLFNAVNNGIAGVCPKSAIVVATKNGTSVANFTAMTAPVALTGGTNGNGVTTAQMIGTDGITGRTGIYALRGSGVQQFILCGNSDPTAYATLQSFAASEGSLAVAALPSGTSTASAITTKQQNNCTSQNAALVKDWLYISDPVTGAQSLVSPLGEALGLISSLAPEQSPGNKPVQGCSNFLSTERTGTPYSGAEAQQLETAGILYFTNPIPRGSVYGFPHGENASASAVGLNAVTDTIAYTRMTNYLGASIPAILGPYIGELQSSRANDPTRSAAKAALTGFLQSLQDQGRIDTFNVTLDLTNNTPITIAQGYCCALVQVAYMNVIKFFLVTLQGGSAVQVGLGNVPQAA
jgi:hypothetical protein